MYQAGQRRLSARSCRLVPGQLPPAGWKARSRFQEQRHFQVCWKREFPLRFQSAVLQGRWSLLQWGTPLVHFVKDKEIAEDITQDIFLTVWEKKEDIRIEQSFSAFLYTCLLYTSVSRITGYGILGRLSEFG